MVTTARDVDEVQVVPEVQQSLQIPDVLQISSSQAVAIQASSSSAGMKAQPERILVPKAGDRRWGLELQR
jgi:hypothetical protein